MYVIVNRLIWLLLGINIVKQLNDLALAWIKHCLTVKLRQSLLCSPKNIGGAYSRRLVRPSVSPSIRPIRVRPITLLFEVGFRNYFTEMTAMLRRRVAYKFGSLPWRSRSQRDLAAKSCPTHNFVIWSQNSEILNRNGHHIKTTCRAQHLGRYLEGQGHSMTLQQNRVRPTTLLFEVGFQKYFTEMITILRLRVAYNIWVATFKVKVTAWPCSKIVPGP